MPLSVVKWCFMEGEAFSREFEKEDECLVIIYTSSLSKPYRPKQLNGDIKIFPATEVAIRTLQENE